ncbi:MAG: glutamyl-tRNA reductase [Omnitrophica bacterium]|nr:glutamyl-tRNA reductase [Candidatus Omnitrophota bacterium]
MSLIVVGTNHKYSPIKLREKISFSQKRLKNALNFLRQNSLLQGAAILSTCNRVEIYASAENPERALGEIEDFIARYHEIDKDSFGPYSYRYIGPQAIKHLFSVTSGLDSLILGETQILNQVKFAFLEAASVDFVDKILAESFRSSLALAKKIHTETKINEGKVSVGSVAVDFIKERLGNLSEKNFLIIGVGKVTDLVLKYLSKEGSNVVFVSNRTFARAEELSQRIGARAVRFDELKYFLKQADVIITATASPHFVIKKEVLERALNHKLLIIDLALPRDVEPNVKELAGVDLFCLEDLETVIKKNKEQKINEAKKVKEIIEREAEKICKKSTKLEQEPALWP